MNIAQDKKKQERDKNYWREKIEKDKAYEASEEQWKKDLLKLNPEVPKPYTR